MPISIVPSGSVRSHSWLFVYRRSAGVWLMRFSVLSGSQFDAGLAIPGERRLHDARGHALAADVHLDAARGRGRQARERDRALERRRERPARDLAFAGGAREDLLVRPQHAAVLEQQAGQLARDTVRELLLERGPADEVAAALERDRPCEP